MPKYTFKVLEEVLLKVLGKQGDGWRIQMRQTLDVKLGQILLFTENIMIPKDANS